MKKTKYVICALVAGRLSPFVDWTENGEPIWFHDYGRGEPKLYDTPGEAMDESMEIRGCETSLNKEMGNYPVNRITVVIADSVLNKTVKSGKGENSMSSRQKRYVVRQAGVGLFYICDARTNAFALPYTSRDAAEQSLAVFESVPAGMDVLRKVFLELKAAQKGKVKTA